MTNEDKQRIEKDKIFIDGESTENPTSHRQQIFIKMRSKTTQKIIDSTPDEIRKSVREYANEMVNSAHNRAKK